MFGIADAATVAENAHVDVAGIINRLVGHGAQRYPSKHLRASARAEHGSLGTVDAVLARRQVDAHAADATTVVHEDVRDHRVVVDGNVGTLAVLIVPVARKTPLHHLHGGQIHFEMDRAVLAALRARLAEIDDVHIVVRLVAVRLVGRLDELVIADATGDTRTALRVPGIANVPVHAARTTKAKRGLVDNEHVLTLVNGLVDGRHGAHARADNDNVRLVYLIIGRDGLRCRGPLRSFVGPRRAQTPGRDRGSGHRTACRNERAPGDAPALLGHSLLLPP